MPFTSRLSALVPQHASNFALPQLHYPINRPYRWKWFTYAAYGFMLLVLAILVPITYASQGYQIVTAYKQDPNTTSIHWYHTFTGRPTPGSQCDDHLFNPGDTFSTSIGILPYTIQTIQYNSSDGLNVFGGTTIPYKGISTDFCDIRSVGMQVGPVEGSVVGTASILCVHKDFQVSATTSFALNGREIMTRYVSDPRNYLDWAAGDLQNQQFHMNGPNISDTVGLSTVTIGATVEIPFCPMSWIKNETNAYGSVIDPIISSGFYCVPQLYNLPPFVLGDIDLSGLGESINIGDYQFIRNAIANYMEVLASVVRYDLGSRLPTNFLVDPSAVLSQNQTFLPVVPISLIPGRSVPNPTSTDLIMDIQTAIEQGYLPLTPVFNASAPNQPAPPTLSTTYACHLVIPKPAGAAIVSVIVATLSIGGSIWGLLMLIAAFFAKRNRPEANCCEYHSIETGLPKSLNASEEHLELQDIPLTSSR